MKRYAPFFAIAAVLATGPGPAAAYERGAVAPAPPVEPSQLFSVPAGRVVRSMDLDISAAGVLFGGSGSRPLATGILGLGDIAQMEAGTLAIVSHLDRRDQLTAVPAAGLKVYVPLLSYAQGLAASFQRTGSYQTQADRVDYKARLGEFYAVATLANYPRPEHATAATAGWRGVKVEGHGGLKYIDAKLTGAGVARAGFWRPVAAVEVWRDNARARVVGELNWTAAFDAEGGERVETVRVVTAGVRFFFSRHTTFDIGVRHQSNYQGIAESAIQTRIHFAIPTHVLRDRVVGN